MNVFKQSEHQLDQSHFSSLVEGKRGDQTQWKIDRVENENNFTHNDKRNEQEFIAENSDKKVNDVDNSCDENKVVKTVNFLLKHNHEYPRHNYPHINPDFEDNGSAQHSQRCEIKHSKSCSEIENGQMLESDPLLHNQYKSKYTADDKPTNQNVHGNGKSSTQHNLKPTPQSRSIPETAAARTRGWWFFFFWVLMAGAVVLLGMYVVVKVLKYFKEEDNQYDPYN